MLKVNFVRVFGQIFLLTLRRHFPIHFFESLFRCFVTDRRVAVWTILKNLYVLEDRRLRLAPFAEPSPMYQFLLQ